MAEFRAGKVEREAVPQWARRFSPASTCLSLEDIDPKRLADEGKKLVLLDVDNTLLPWKSESIPESTHEWVETARRAGLRLCILSNTRHPARLERIAEKLGVDWLRGKFKPNPAMYHRALEQFGAKPSEAVMIGDQLFTDVWGANRAGIDAIWVRPMTGRDFIGTKVSRMGERLLRPMIHGAMTETLPDESGIEPESAITLLRIPVVRQFLKFVIVGGSSTVIDLGLHFLLMFVIPVGNQPLGTVFGQWLVETFPSVFHFAQDRVSDAAVPVFKVFSASIAILNSFYWNRRWTFRIVGHEERLTQFRRFLVIVVIGLLLNTAITTGLNNVIVGHAKRSWAVANAVATVAVAFWNFAGQKLWAFRHHGQSPSNKSVTT